MPVLLTEEHEFDTWLTGSTAAAYGLVRSFEPERMHIAQKAFEKQYLLARETQGKSRQRATGTCRLEAVTAASLNAAPMAPSDIDSIRWEHRWEVRSAQLHKLTPVRVRDETS